MRTPKETKIPGFPQLPADASPAMRRYLESVAEALEIRLGRRGDSRDRAITARELIDSGLAVEGKPFILGQSQSSLLPIGTDVNETSLPTAPTGFGATGAYSVVILEWDAANYFPHAYTEVWRHTADQLADAVLVGISHGMMFTDQVGGGQANYYWVRHVNTRNQKGPWNSSAGTFAETAIDVAFILELLTGSITEDAFYQGLTDKIDLIDAHELSIADIELAVSTVETNLATAQSAIATAQVTIAANQNDITSLETVTATQTSLITNLNTTVGSNSSNITTLQQTTATNASDITSLETTVNHPTTGVGATASALSGLQTTVTSQGNSITTNASDITNLETTVNHPTTGVDATAGAVSTLSNTVTQQGNNISTNASDITSLETTVNDPTTGVNATAGGLSSLSTTVTTQGTSITSHGSRLNALESTVNDPSTGLSATATGLSNLTTTVTSQAGTISANAQDINAIEITIGSSTSGLVQQINTVESSVNTVTGQISTLSSSVNQVNTTVNGFSTTVSQNSTSIDGIEGEYAVKIDSNGTVAGFGLINGGSSSSAFYVRADKFAIGNTAGSSQLPFIVTTSAQFLNGQYVPAGVYIQDAFIKNGVITSAKIGLLAVDTAQMANLAVTTGKIDNLAVTGAKIDNATITTAKIGDAQITSALIGDLQVDTLKIANQAVTVPSGVNQDTFLTLSTAWQTVCSITVNMGTGVQAVLVSAFHNFQNTSQTSTQYDIAMKIEANGSGGGSVAQTHNNQTSVLSSMAKYGALTGNVLFTIQVKKNASAGTYLARNSGLLVQGIKK